jgi:hypothetical protein
MALDVIYMRGSKERYEEYLAAGKIVPTTFYYLDGKELYLGTIKLSNQEDIELAKSSLESTLVNDYVTKEALNIALDEIKVKLEDIGNIFNYKGAFETLPTSMDDFTPGDIIIITKGENAGKQYICNQESDGTKVWVEIESSGELTALEEKVKFIEEEMKALKVALQNFEKVYATKGELVSLTNSLTSVVEAERIRAQERENELEEEIKNLFGSANPNSVDLGDIIKAINQLAGNNAGSTEIGEISTSVKDLTEKVSSTENLLVWEE